MVYYLVAAKLLSLIIGIDGVWLGYIVSETLTILTIIITTWIKSGHFPKSIHDYLILPDSFGVSAENRMNVTAVSVEQVVGISEKILKFCKGKNIEGKRSYAAALCIEELAVIAMETNDAKKAYVDIYVTFKDEELKITMRDNSRPFDKNLLAGNPKEDDPCAHVGVRIVKGMAKEVSYQVVLGMNMYSLKV